MTSLTSECWPSVGNLASSPTVHTLCCPCVGSISGLETILGYCIRVNIGTIILYLSPGKLVSIIADPQITGQS